jgi:5-methyltetrahydropteroyltriglutamate--homocysteine methyltransferase
MIEAFKKLNVHEIHLEHCSLHYKMLDVFNDWNFDGKISLGVIDQRIDNTETEDDIINAVKPALEYFPKEKILLTSECGFGHVPIDIVRNKIKMLVSTAKKL